MTYTVYGFWGWLKTWKLECSNRALKRKLRATHRVRKRVPRNTAGAWRWVWSESFPTENSRRFHYLEQGDRPEQDGRRGLPRQRGRGGGCEANRFRRKTRGVFIILIKAFFKKSSRALTRCNFICTRVPTVLLYEYRHLIVYLCGQFGIRCCWC